MKEVTNANPAHLNWIDLVRVVAVFQVVLIHLSFVIFFKEELLSPNWIAANFYDSFSRMGVPLFFMVSGFLLLGKVEPIPEFFRKRFVKVGFPIVFWSVFYMFRSVDAYSNGKMNPLAVTLSMLKTAYLGDVEIHLWFLYILVGVYLVVPILRVFVSSASQSDLIFFSLIWFVATPLLELAQRITGFKTALIIPVVAGYVGYFVIGYLLAQVKLSSRGRILSVLGIIAAIAVTFFGTNILSADSAPIDTFFYSYFSLPTVPAAICGFLLLKDIGQNFGFASKILRAVSASSFGIFLIHILVIGLLRKGYFGFRLYSWMGPTWYMIPVTAIAVFSISFAFVFIMRKIPLIKTVVP